MKKATSDGEGSMPAEHRKALVGLQEIPNVGPAMAGDLIRLGILRLEDAVGRDPDEMYGALCNIDGTRHDPCVRDVFASVVAYAHGGPRRPWWEFTPERKARERSTKEEP